MYIQAADVCQEDIISPIADRACVYHPAGVNWNLLHTVTSRSRRKKLPELIVPNVNKHSKNLNYFKIHKLSKLLRVLSSFWENACFFEIKIENQDHYLFGGSTQATFSLAERLRLWKCHFEGSNFTKALESSHAFNVFLEPARAVIPRFYPTHCPVGFRICVLLWRRS